MWMSWSYTCSNWEHDRSQHSLMNVYTPFTQRPRLYPTAHYLFHHFCLNPIAILTSPPIWCSIKHPTTKIRPIPIGNTPPKVYSMPSTKPSKCCGWYTGIKRATRNGSRIKYGNTFSRWNSHKSATAPPKRKAASNPLETFLSYSSRVWLAVTCVFLLWLMKVATTQANSGIVNTPHQFDIPGRSSRASKWCVTTPPLMCSMPMTRRTNISAPTVTWILFLSMDVIDLDGLV
jgi:hypothetical protein